MPSAVLVIFVLDLELSVNRVKRSDGTTRENMFNILWQINQDGFVFNPNQMN